MISNKRLHPIMLLAVTITCFFSTQLFTGRSYFIRDITYIFQPWKTTAIEALQSGQMPMWNHYVFCGMPFIGNWQTAVFYPFSILFAVLPFSTGLIIFQGFQLFIAGFFAYLFFRRIGLRRHAAGVGMAAFSFSGYVLMHLEFLSHLSSIAWLFAMLLFSGCWWALSMAIAICLLGGHPVSFLCIGILAAYTMFNERPPILQGAAIMALALLTSFFITAIQLLPVAELARHASRVLNGILSSDAYLNALTLRGLSTIISPFLQDPASKRVFGEAFAWANTVTIGAIAVILAVIGAVVNIAGTHKRFGYCAIIFVVSGVVLALGNATYIYPWLNGHLPGINLLRYPTQYFLLALAGLAMLCALGADKMRAGGVVALLVVCELILSFCFFQPAAGGSYFHFKPPSVRILQAQTGYSRFILSPATQSDHYMNYAPDYGASWQQSRSLMLGLTCMPYQLHNAYGLGEPLVFAPVETLVNKAYTSQNPQSAIAAYGALGVQYLVCRHRLANEKGYSLINDKPPFIYDIGEPSAIESFEPGDKARLTLRRESFTNLSYEFTAIEPSFVTVRVSALPGWQLFAEGLQMPLEITGEGFMRFPIFPGVTHATLKYNPVSFVIGLWLTICTMLFLISKAYWRIKRGYQFE